MCTKNLHLMSNVKFAKIFAITAHDIFVEHGKAKENAFALATMATQVPPRLARRIVL